ncbi:MAG TPA: glycosyltransferase [Acidimicrobiia bacterium]|jgi:hypothetical protein
MKVDVTLAHDEVGPAARGSRFDPPSRQWINFDHLASMTGPAGLYEHAEFSHPRKQGGYSLDDNGRALVIVGRAHAARVEVPAGLGGRYLDFVVGARSRVNSNGSGGWSDRKDASGRWLQGSTDDAIGRALWGLGVAASSWPDERSADLALDMLLESGDFTSLWWRPIAYALLGFCAAEAVRPQADGLVGAVAALSAALPRPTWRSVWPWPEARLTYDNARLPEALLSAGRALDDSEMIADGLHLLEWLIEEEIGRNGFSFTPVGGRSRQGQKPAYDQQPIEAWAMADATARAGEVSGDVAWMAPAQVAVSWLMGLNDRGAALYDPATGACFDGLTPTGANLNQGAESTLSALGAILAMLKPASSP